MNEILEKMQTRRSIRKFKPDAVPSDIIDEMITAGTYAASGRNAQSPVIVAVTNKDVRDRMAAVNASCMGSQSDPFYGAPVILVVLADKSKPTYVYDGSLVMGNLMLAAHSLGLGSCWIHRAKETFELPEWKEWLASIGLDGDYEGIASCAVGYADGDEPDIIPRKAGRVFYVK